MSQSDTQYRVILWTDPETGHDRHLVVRPVIHLDVVADCRTRDAAEKLAAELNAREAA
jgi:hypothetical protein